MKDIKTVIIDRIIEEVEIQIKNAERGRLDAIEESKAHKGAMASRYDTFKEEAQYLAGGFASRLVELGKTLGALKSIRDYPPTVTKVHGYALVEVENLENGSRSKYFLLPSGGGNIYEIEGEEISVLSVGAPMARAFMGTVPGDEVEIKIQETTRRFSVVSVT
jgi:transcription elongation GreA/GreB family factor